MRSIVLLCILVSISLAATLQEQNVADGLNLDRAEWGEFTGTVTLKRSRLILTDNTGSIKLRFRRTPYYIKEEFRQSLNNGDTLTIIGVKESKRKETFRPLLIQQNNTQIFRQKFFKREKPFPNNITKTELNHLQFEYSMFYSRKAKANFVFGGISLGFGLLAVANVGTSEDWGVAIVSGITALSFIAPTVANTTAGILYQRRANRVPDYETPKVTFNLQLRTSKESNGLFLVGSF